MYVGSRLFLEFNSFCQTPCSKSSLILNWNKSEFTIFPNCPSFLTLYPKFIVHMAIKLKTKDQYPHFLIVFILSITNLLCHMYFQVFLGSIFHSPSKPVFSQVFSTLDYGNHLFKFFMFSPHPAKYNLHPASNMTIAETKI